MAGPGVEAYSRGPPPFTPALLIIGVGPVQNYCFQQIIGATLLPAMAVVHACMQRSQLMVVQRKDR